LLHPLGGGQKPLDAIVVIDTNGKRRLVLPFGWGAGLHVIDPLTGAMFQGRLAALLNDGIKALEKERHKSRKDFYDIARTYF
jgi:hypothetical protein